VAQEVDLFRHTSAAEKDYVALKAALKANGMCDRLVQNYMPYNWLEWLCEELLDEHIEGLIEVFQFHDRIAKSGLTPDETPAQMMCKEFYGCKPSKSQRKEL